MVAPPSVRRPGAAATRYRLPHSVIPVTRRSITPDGPLKTILGVMSLARLASPRRRNSVIPAQCSRSRRTTSRALARRRKQRAEVEHRDLRRLDQGLGQRHRELQPRRQVAPANAAIGVEPEPVELALQPGARRARRGRSPRPSCRHRRRRSRSRPNSRLSRTLAPCMILLGIVELDILGGIAPADAP